MDGLAAIEVLREHVAKLNRFHDEVMAGCDIQKGDRLYRQVPVVIGPGKIQAELDAEAAQEQVKKAWLEIEQCHAKSTCCCGDYIKQHSTCAGHTPVAMYDYALDIAEAQKVELVVTLKQITQAIDRTTTSGEIRREHDKIKQLVADSLAKLDQDEAND